MTEARHYPSAPGPIGVFDSGYGGLTILQKIRALMPQYDFLYLGDNARTPYGTRSFDVVYEFTRQAVDFLFNCGCHLVILACNTASAKALRTIQQKDLIEMDSLRRVLGVIRPTVECLGGLSQSKHVGVLATHGTVRSNTYELEIAKLFPELTVVSEACPMWVPLVENEEADQPGADYFVKKHIDNLFQKDSLIDTIVLGCTHYPLLINKIRQYVSPDLQIVSQGEYVADSLKNYLQRHPEMDALLTKEGSVRFLTTEQPDTFQTNAGLFLHSTIRAERVFLR